MKTRTLLACLLMGLIALTGCGGQENTASDTATENGTTEDAARRIAVIPKGLAHQFWLTVKAGADAAGKETDTEIIWQGPAKETEVAKQINIVQDMMSKGVDAIVLAACDENALVPQIDAAMDRGIPVVTIDSGVQSDRPVSFVATDNVAGARAAADVLMELTGGGKVALIAFVPGAATSELRERGFEEGVAAHPELELVATQHCFSDVAKAMDITQDLLTSHSDLKGIFAANEAAAIGAAQGVKAAGKAGDVKIVAFDAAKEEVSALQEGSLQALIVQNPFNMGYLGVKAALDSLDGKEVEKRIDTGVTVVTMENLNDPEVQEIINPTIE